MDFNMKNKISYILLFSILITACSEKKSAEETQTIAENESQEIVLTKGQLGNIQLDYCSLEQKNIGAIIKANGSIDVPPESMVSISAPFGGYLKYTKLLPGMKISKGQLLAVLEDEKYVQMQQEYLSAKNKLELAKIDFEKQKELYQEKAISEKAYLTSKSEFEILQIQVQSFSEKLKLIGIDPLKFKPSDISAKMEIHSPIAGYISKVNVNVGKYISSNEIMFELINPDDIHLNIQVYQKDINSIAIGQKAIAYTNENPDKKYLTEIILISRGLNENKAIDVHCHFEKEDHNLIPGMFMNVEIESSLHNAMVIKESAVLRFENNNYVVEALNDSTFKLVKVNVGIKEEPFVQILEPNAELKEAKIVNKDAYKILMAMKNKSEE